MSLIGGSIRYFVVLSCSLLLIDVVIGSPVPAQREDKDLVLVPMAMPATRFIQVPINPSSFYFQPYPPLQRHPNPQTRGPFDFIGQWIQQTPWLPIQVNVPDIFQNIGNGISQAGNTVTQLGQTVGNNVAQFTQGVQQFGQNIGNGVSQFGQNVGNGFNQFTQNVGNGFNNWMQQVGQRVPILGNFVGNRAPVVTQNGQQQLVMMVPIEYPGGQQLVLANEALEAFP